MKKLIALLMLVLLWYFSGMYRQGAVMAVTICLAVMIPVLAVTAFIQKRNLKLTLPKTQLIAYKGIEKAVTIYAENKGLLPVNYFKVWLLLSYQNDRKPLKRKLTGSALGKRSAENRSEFYLTAPYCGIIDVELRKMRVYDNLALFSSRKKLNEHLKVLVFPVPAEMDLRMPSFGSYDSFPVTDSVSEKSGDDHSEIRMIREYRPGDLNRHIHQNYSARTDSLWVKEFHKENDYFFDVILDTSSDQPPDAETLDALYEIFYSLIITLIHKEILLKVHWFDSRLNGLRESSIENEGQAAQLLASIYNTDTSCTRECFARSANELMARSMTINTSLEWYFYGKAVHRFNKALYRRELNYMSFEL